MNKFIKLSIVIFVFGIILVGCGSNKELIEKKENKVLLYIIVKDIGDMNFYVYGGLMFVESMIYELLVCNIKDGIKLLLVKKWDILFDGKIYMFYLRDDVFFYDGMKFDVDVVKKNIDVV